VIALNYDKQIVFILFAIGSDGNLAPSADDIVRFDQELHQANEQILQEILPEMGLPVDVPTKSQILAYKPQMPGNNPRLQIRSACTFFINTSNL
jgi:hypothetical protein